MRRLHIVRHASSCCHSKKSVTPRLTTLAFWKDPTTWQRTRINTLRCLVGCTTGDFSAMWYMQVYHPDVSPALNAAVAMATGLSTSLALETVLLKRSLQIPYGKAFSTAMGMSFTSMLAMELAENVVDWHMTGGQVLLSDPKFWFAAVVSMGAGYVVPLPYNYWRLRALGKACH